MSEEKKVDGRRATALKNLELGRQKKNELLKLGKQAKEQEAMKEKVEILESDDESEEDSESEDDNMIIIKPKGKQKATTKPKKGKGEEPETPKQNNSEMEELRNMIAELKSQKSKPKSKPRKTVINLQTPKPVVNEQAEHYKHKILGTSSAPLALF